MEGASAQALLFVIGLAISATAFIGVVFVANILLSPRSPSAREELTLRVRH